ncbi:GyrI-like domain-containing protein [Microbacterium sp. NPDC096154]|uniref:GyrI-like domain-containing protein n=1 Tax=Microbacterium sp. NPDC096154 TaxID=3155549 RepID=UPI003323F9BD
MTDKPDVKTQDAYRAKRGELRILEVPDARYLMIDGQGDPNTSPMFAEAVGALYPLAYRLKFASRRVLGRDYVVPPLEGLWWADDPTAFTSARDKERWNWTLMILVPEWIGPDLFAETAAALPDAPARVGDVRLESLAEGRCVQTLHVGSFDDEGPTLARMHDEFIPAHGLRMTGRHHEIYLSDFRRVPPERRRTILRQPVAPGEPPTSR